MKFRISIGIPSIILIFMILCLAVFSLLSLSDAQTALTFAEKRAETVQLYYQADAAAQEWLRDCRISQQHSGSPVSAEFPLGNGQTLFLEAAPDGKDILSYYVYNSTDLTIDSDLQVWDGD